MPTAEQIEDARAEAEVAYYRATAAALDGVSASYRGGVRTRLDSSWSSLQDQYIGAVRSADLHTLASLRGRSQRLEQVNWLAYGVLDRTTENVLGGWVNIVPRSADEDWNKRAKKWWDNWILDCDLRGRLTFHGICCTSYRGRLRDGNYGVALVRVRGRPKLQLIRPERIKTPPHLMDGRLSNSNHIIGGVEIDGVGRAVRYWIAFTDAAGQERFTPVDARDFIHLHYRGEADDVHTPGAFLGGFTLFEQIAGYLESAVVAARVGASQAMIVKKKSPAKALSQIPDGTQTETGETQKHLPIEPGQINVIDLVEEMTGFNPTQPTQSLPDAVAAFCRFVGLKFGLTLEQVLLDFSRTNYSSSRAARAQAERTAETEREYFVPAMISRTYRWAISAAVQLGELPDPPEDSWAHEWIPPPLYQPDPAKAMAAAVLGESLGIEALSYLAAELGYDFEALCARREADNELLAKHNLPLPSGQAASGRESSKPNEDDQDEADARERRQQQQDARAQRMALATALMKDSDANK